MVESKGLMSSRQEGQSQTGIRVRTLNQPPTISQAGKPMTPNTDRTEVNLYFSDFFIGPTKIVDGSYEVRISIHENACSQVSK
jgi:hypothetical protein